MQHNPALNRTLALRAAPVSLVVRFHMVTGTISISDYLSAQRLHRAVAVRWYYLAAVTAVALGVGVYGFFQQSLGIILVGAGIGGAMGEYIMSFVYLPWKVRRIHRQQKDLAFPFTYTWDSEFLKAQSVGGQSKRKWTNYVRCKENENLFLLYHADNLFEMFPKSWFQDQAQLIEFRSLANRAKET